MKDLVPKEGATGWLDTWMVSSKTKNLDCAYKWLAWISTPKVQAQQAIYFGETPVNKLACKEMDKISEGLVREVPRGRAALVLPADPLLEDADRRLRQRQEGLHGLHEVAAGLDRAQGLSGPVCQSAPPGRRRALEPPVAQGPRASSRSRRPRSSRSTSPRSSRSSSRRSGRSTRSRASSSTTGRPSTSRRSGTTRSTAASRCGRSRSPRS